MDYFRLGSVLCLLYMMLKLENCCLLADFCCLFKNKFFYSVSEMIGGGFVIFEIHPIYVFKNLSTFFYLIFGVSGVAVVDDFNLYFWQWLTPSAF